MRATRVKSGQEGYMLLALMLVVTLMLIALAMEAPRLAQQIKRDREEELIHRGTEYATAVKRFVHKNGGRYPLSIDQLEDTNHIRFLRKRYKDPITGESEWRLVHFGEAQIKIPAPNPGLNPSGNPGLQGSNPGLGGNPGGGPTGNPPANNNASAFSSGGQLTQTNQSGASGQLGTLTTNNIGNGQPIGGGQIIGVASNSKGTSIKEFNEKNHYDEWFFVYDLRLEQGGGTGVTIGAPRVGGSSSEQQGQGQQTPRAVPPPIGTPTPGPNPN
jgi:type II secretory pathway pseudopilin PulG